MPRKPILSQSKVKINVMLLKVYREDFVTVTAVNKILRLFKLILRSVT